MDITSQRRSGSASAMESWLPWVLLATILLAVNASVLEGLYKTWRDSYAEMGHGFIAPPLAIYLAWQKREQLALLPKQGSTRGLVLCVVAGILVILSELSQWVFFGQFGVWAIIVGALWYLLGIEWVKALRFPLFLLFLAIPPPSFLYTRITFEMQLLASRLAEKGLEVLGYSVLREGNILQMVGEKLSVAEACSGIRSLTTLLFFITIYSYFMVSESRLRWMLVLTTVPIAIMANALRIVATGVLSQYDRALAHGITHEISGYLTLLAGGSLCVGLAEIFARKGSARI